VEDRTQDEEAEMKKLNPDELRVESFDAGALEDAHAALSATNTGCNPDRTQVLTIPCCP
jgi:hypothetical protein